MLLLLLLVQHSEWVSETIDFRPSSSQSVSFVGRGQPMVDTPEGRSAFVVAAAAALGSIGLLFSSELPDSTKNPNASFTANLATHAALFRIRLHPSPKEDKHDGCFRPSRSTGYQPVGPRPFEAGKAPPTMKGEDGSHRAKKIETTSEKASCTHGREWVFRAKETGNRSLR